MHDSADVGAWRRVETNEDDFAMLVLADKLTPLSCWECRVSSTADCRMCNNYGTYYVAR